MTQRLLLADESATIELGTQLARQIPERAAGWLILLQGELGAGKSTLARALIRGLGHDGPVPSPTYTLVEPYELAGGTVYHVDLYRIGSAEELEFLGWDELSDGLLLVEWPERVPGLFAQADVLIRLDYQASGRVATIVAQSERATAWQKSVDFTGAGGPLLVP